MRRHVDYESPEPSRAKVETDRPLCKAVQENEHAQADVPEHNHLDSTLPQTGCRRVPLAPPRVSLKCHCLPLPSRRPPPASPPPPSPPPPPPPPHPPPHPLL